MLTISELVHLNFEHFEPHPNLRPWVQGYWRISGGLQTGPHLENCYPDGGVGLVFDLSPNSHRSPWISAKQSVHKVEVTGLQVGIRFKPTGVHQLFKLNAHDLINQTAPLEQPPLPGLEKLHLDLQSDKTQKWKQLIDHWLLRFLTQNHCCISVSEAYIEQQQIAFLSVEEFLAQQSISRRNFERHFRAQTGISPGQFKRWQRIKLARQRIKQQLDRSLTDIAIACGFYDQAHFTRQFKAVTGVTPNQYQIRQRERLVLGEMRIKAISKPLVRKTIGKPVQPINRQI